MQDVLSCIQQDCLTRCIPDPKLLICSCSLLSPALPGVCQTRLDSDLGYLERPRGWLAGQPLRSTRASFHVCWFHCSLHQMPTFSLSGGSQTRLLVRWPTWLILPGHARDFYRGLVFETYGAYMYVCIRVRMFLVWYVPVWPTSSAARPLDQGSCCAAPWRQLPTLRLTGFKRHRRNRIARG